MSQERFEDFDERFTNALREWAGRVPNPDAAIFPGYTVRELISEVEGRTEFGQLQLEAARHYAMVNPEVGPDGVIEMFTSGAMGADPFSPRAQDPNG